MSVPRVAGAAVARHVSTMGEGALSNEDAKAADGLGSDHPLPPAPRVPSMSSFAPKGARASTNILAPLAERFSATENSIRLNPVATVAGERRTHDHCPGSLPPKLKES